MCCRAIVGKKHLPGEIRALANRMWRMALWTRLERQFSVEDVRRFVLEDTGRPSPSGPAPRAEDLRKFLETYRSAQESSGRKRPRARDVASLLFPDDAEGTAGNKLTAHVRELFGEHARWSTVHAEVASLGCGP